MAKLSAEEKALRGHKIKQQARSNKGLTTKDFTYPLSYTKNPVKVAKQKAATKARNQAREFKSGVYEEVISDFTVVDEMGN